MSLRTQLVVAFLAIVLFLTGVLGWIAFRTSGRLVKESAVAMVGEAAESRKQGLVRIFERQQAHAAALAKLLLEECGPSYETGCVSPRLDQFSRVVQAAGAMVEVSGRPTVRFAPGDDFRIPPARPEGEAAVRFHRSGNGWKYDLTAVAGDLRVTLRFDPSWIISIFEGIQGLGETAEVFLTDPEGNVLTPLLHSHVERMESWPIQECLAGRSGELLAEDPTGRPVVHGYRAVPEIGGGCVMSHIEQAEAFRQTAGLRRKIVGTFALFALLAAVVSMLIARLVTGPVERLRSRAHALQEGDFDSPVPVAGPRELRAFAETFAEMAASLRQSRASLQASQQQVQAIINSAPLAILAVGLDDTVSMWNPAAEELFGWSSAEVAGRALPIVPPEAAAEYAHMRQKVGQGRSYTGLEAVALRQDGGRLPIVISVAPLRDASGQTTGALAVLRDVTEERKAEAERARLQAAEQEAHEEAERAHDRLAFLAEASAVLGASLDYETTLATVARLAVPHIADWSVVDLLAEDGALKRLAVQHFNPEKVGMVEELQRRYPPHPDQKFGVYQVLRTGKPELVSHIPDGFIEQVALDEDHLRLIRGLQSNSSMVVPLVARNRTLGTLSLVMAESGRAYSPQDLEVAVDLGRRAGIAIDNARLLRESEEQLRHRTESEEKFRAVAETAASGIYIHDGQKLLYVNRAVETITGYSRDQLLHMDMWSLVHPDFREEVMRRAASRLQVGVHAAPIRYEYKILHRSGQERWVDFSAATVNFGGRRAILATAFDITEKKLAEEALRVSEKLAATGRLAATIAHEINNPLAAVTNLLYLLNGEPAMDDSGRRMIEMAQQELARVVHIVRQTLGFYRETSTPVMVSLPQILDNVLELYDRRIQENKVEVVREFRTQAQILAFPGEMRQVFSNLVVNAIDASGCGGRLRLRVRERMDWEHPERRGISVAVADAGSGIAPEARAKIFEPFFTTKGERGTGLGLWVTLGILQKHGGRIRLRTSVEPGRSGTTFIIFLPLAPSAAITEDLAGAASHGG